MKYPAEPFKIKTVETIEMTDREERKEICECQIIFYTFRSLIFYT